MGGGQVSLFHRSHVLSSASKFTAPVTEGPFPMCLLDYFPEMCDPAPKAQSLHVNVLLCRLTWSSRLKPSTTGSVATIKFLVPGLLLVARYVCREAPRAGFCSCNDHTSSTSGLIR